MSIWFDKLGNKYANAGKFSWLKAYTDKQVQQIKELFTKHVTGEKDRHTGAMIDYSDSQTVTQAIDAIHEDLSALETSDTSLNSSISKKANISANSEGGFCAGTGAAVTKGGSATGKNASSITGCAAGQSAVTETGGSTGVGTESKKGFAGGQNSTTTNGASSGYLATSSYGGAVGEYAKTVDGFAGGQNARTSDGVAVGKNARCTVSTAADSAGIDAIQLGTGNNTTSKTLQIYSYPLLNANGTIPLERMQLLNDTLTQKINAIQGVLADAGLFNEVTDDDAGWISYDFNCNLGISNGIITPYINAPTGSVTLLEKTVDLSSYTTIPYAYQTGVAHTFTCCLHGVIENGEFKATQLYVTENPPETHQITYWDNTFDLLIYHKELTASGGNGEDYYLFTAEYPIAVKLRGNPPSDTEN